MPPQRKSFRILSRRLATLTGIGNNDKKIYGDVGERTINKSQLSTLRQVHPLPTHQPPFHFFNNTIPNRGGLVRSTQRQTQISHRENIPEPPCAFPNFTY
jgi:hypothetical protein